MPRVQSTINLLDGYGKKPKPKRLVRGFYFFIVHLFALAGLFFIGSFALSRLHLTNVDGSVDEQNQLFEKFASSQPLQQVRGTSTVNSLADIQQSIEQLNGDKLQKMQLFCLVSAMNQFAGDNAGTITQLYKNGVADSMLVRMVQAVRIRLNSNPDAVASFQVCDNLTITDTAPDYDAQVFTPANSLNVFSWTQDETWPPLSAAMLKDKSMILSVASLVNVEPRLLVAAMFAEQSRLFRTDRGLFKKYLAPLQILASENQFSLGVMGIKPATAQEVEKNLVSTSSPMYLGPQYQHLLDFTSSNIAAERYSRLTDDKNHYYSYLYGALYIKELQQQWQNQGFLIANRPEIVGTLYNIGFSHSKPNADPSVGGSVIPVNGVNYTYGSLVYEFYYSGQLINDFPFGG